MIDNVVFFRNKNELIEWMEKNSTESKELWLGYYKKHTNEKSITWGESVDCALMFGWIDGIRKTIDEDRYMIRFTPRKPNSVWGKVNVDKAQTLIEENLMRPEGLTLYKQRIDKVGYSVSSKENIVLPVKYEKIIKVNKEAWGFYKKLPFGYKRDSIHWIMESKKEVTQLNRLNKLIVSWQNNIMYRQ